MKHGLFCLLPLSVLIVLIVLALSALTGCARFDRDPLQVYRIDPAAFGIPLTTVFTVPF